MTGPGSLAAVLAQGIDPAVVDAPDVDGGQFDSEALWQRVGTSVQPGSRVLIVRGSNAASRVPPEAQTGEGRDWLAQQIQAAGGQVDFVVAYQRQVPRWPAQQQIQAQAAAQGGDFTWLLSSSEAVHNLPKLLPGQDWSQARALATHPRIAQAARQLGFGRVHETGASLSAIVTSVKSIT